MALYKFRIIIIIIIIRVSGDISPLGYFSEAAKNRSRRIWEVGTFWATSWTTFCRLGTALLPLQP